MCSDRVSELKRGLDRLLGEAEVAGEPTADERLVLDEAVANFRREGPGLLDQATPHLWAYYRSVADEFSPDERVDYGIPELADSTDIWDEVQLSLPPTLWLGRGPLEPGRSYIDFEGEVSWEPEHGVQLVFEHGLRVCKVGPCNGHRTNAHAYADESLLNEVFVQ